MLVIFKKILFLTHRIEKRCEVPFESVDETILIDFVENNTNRLKCQTLACKTINYNVSLLINYDFLTINGKLFTTKQ